MFYADWIFTLLIFVIISRIFSVIFLSGVHFFFSNCLMDKKSCGPADVRYTDTQMLLKPGAQDVFSYKQTSVTFKPSAVHTMLIEPVTGRSIFVYIIVYRVFKPVSVVTLLTVNRAKKKTKDTLSTASLWCHLVQSKAHTRIGLTPPNSCPASSGRDSTVLQTCKG